MKKQLILAGFLAFSMATQAQDGNGVYQTFKDTRIINTHSVEVLQKNVLDLRISHRFGDMFGAAGGWPTFYGLENAADISIGVDYGVLDNLTVGLHRAKGAGPIRQNLNGLVKYRIFHQTNDGAVPISMTAVGTGMFTTMRRDTNNTTSLAAFPKFAHRLSYSLQLPIARKFGNAFSLQLSPMFLWRNYVRTGDENGMFAMGIAMRIQLSKVFGLIIDGNLPISRYRWSGNDGSDYINNIALGIGLEIETGGHVFQVNLTNTAGLLATDYIPYTNSNWIDE